MAAIFNLVLPLESPPKKYLNNRFEKVEIHTLLTDEIVETYIIQSENDWKSAILNCGINNSTIILKKNCNKLYLKKLKFLFLVGEKDTF